MSPDEPLAQRHLLDPLLLAPGADDPERLDLRPHVLGIEARDRSLVMTLRPVASRTVRPEQVLAVLRGSTPEQVPSEEPIHVTKLAPVDDHVCVAMPEVAAPSP